MRVIEQLINRARTRAAAERLLVKRNVCFSKSFQDGSMKSRVFASPQLHQGTAGIGLFNHLIRFGHISDERDVAAAAEYRSVWKLRIAGRADHDAGKSTTAGIRGVSLSSSRTFFTFRYQEILYSHDLPCLQYGVSTRNGILQP